MSELDHDKYTPSSATSPRVPNVSAQRTKFGPQFRRSPPPRVRGVRHPEHPSQADYENPAWSEFNIARDAYKRGVALVPLQDRALKAIQELAHRGQEFRRAGTRKAPSRRPPLSWRAEPEVEEEEEHGIWLIPDDEVVPMERRRSSRVAVKTPGRAKLKRTPVPEPIQAGRANRLRSEAFVPGGCAQRPAGARPLSSRVDTMALPRPSFGFPSVSMSLARTFDAQSVPVHAPAPAEVSPSQATPSSAPAPSSSPSWMAHVKEVWGSLKAADLTTTYKQAMTHAKASFKKPPAHK
jgi:hypothetical protein